MKERKREILSKLPAIAVIGMGIHLLIAYQAKTLPLGLISDNPIIWSAWGFLGIWCAIFLVVIGAALWIELE